MKAVLLLLCLLVSSPVLAHLPSTAYLDLITNSEGSVKGHLQWRLFDLEQVIGLDLNRDGELYWAEVEARYSELANYVAKHLRISAGDIQCRLSIDSRMQLNQQAQGSYLVLGLTGQCPRGQPLSLVYDGLFAQVGQHKLLLQSQSDNGISQRVVSDSMPVMLTSASTWTTFKDYVIQGVIHIWIGIDHLAFLLTLLLVTVVTRQAGEWQPVGPRQTVITATRLISLFTLAHSLTLAAVMFDVLQVPVYWVELIIALTVGLAALNNIWPVVKQLSLLVFGFGLIHGLGFAAVLAELINGTTRTGWALAGFNVGVEVGQLAVVIAVLPILISLRLQQWYRVRAVPMCSGIIALCSLYWLVTRW